MNLFSLGQRLLNEARQLFSQLQTPANGQQQQQPSVLQRFGIFNFNGNANAKADERLHNLSENVPASAGAYSLESASLAATAQTSGRKWTWGEGANKNGYLITLRPEDVGLKRWQGVDPKAVSRAAMEKAVLKMGVTNDPAKVKEIVGKLQIEGMNTWTTSGYRAVKASDYADKDWMNERLDSRNNYAVNLPPEDVANILATSKEVLGADFKAPTNISKSQLGLMGINITGGGLTATIALRGASVFGGGLMKPALIAAGAGLPFAIVTSQYLKEAVDNGLLRERTQVLPLPYNPNITMEDAGEAPSLPPFGNNQPLLPPPPFVTPSQQEKVKTELLTTPAAAPQIATNVPPRTNQPLPPPPFVTPVEQQKAEDLIFLSRQAEILAKNMEAAGMGVKPAGFAAHHIVPYNDGRQPEYDDARNILAKYGIDRNAATNGVYLPHKNDVYIGGMYHPTIHTEGYALELIDRLNKAEAAGTTIVEKKQYVEEALQDIAEELKSHTFPIHRRR